MLSGQIYRAGASGVNADTAVATSYSHLDSIFIFYQPKSGSLLAHRPNGIPVTFQWTKFNVATKQFDIPLPITDSVANGLISGGYQVNIKGTGYDSTHRAWVFLDTLSVSLKKTKDGEVSIFNSTCEALDLIEQKAMAATFIYYNTSTSKNDTLKNSIRYHWWNNPVKSFTVNKDALPKLRILKGEFPYDTTMFYVEAIDKFGLHSKPDSVKYIPTRPEVKFDTVPLSRERIIEGKYSAPFTYSFVNKTKNAVKYTWHFGDPYAKFFGQTDTSLLYDKSTVEHIYYTPDTCDVLLVATSTKPYECVDSAKVTVVIDAGQIGEDGTFEVPNVFTPNDDGKNDILTVKNISIRQYKFTIYSRWGKKVYEYEYPDMNEVNKNGWDGKIHGQYASSGLYYYILEVKTWDRNQNLSKLKNKNGIYKGFFYLYR